MLSLAAVVLTGTADLSAQTIDEYVAVAESNMLWMNGVRAIMKPVADLNDHGRVFQEAFAHMSLDEGRPLITEVEIIEAKTVLLHGNRFHFIRYAWKGKARLLEIDLSPIPEGEWKGMWSVR